MITKKDILYVSIDRAMIQYGSCYDFVIKKNSLLVKLFNLDS